jgi:cytochrome b6-f complex iron-sulfur subunit
MEEKEKQEGQSQNKKEESNDPKGRMGRRDFLITVGSGSVGVVAAGSVLWTYKYLFPNTLLEPPMMFNAGPVERYREGVSSELVGDQRVFVVRRQNNLYALVAICTHLGCVPPWRQSEGLFHCPCHGSKFSVEGDVLRGPAREPLYRAPVELTEDGQIRVGTGLLGIRLPWQANRDPERSSDRYVLRV